MIELFQKSLGIEGHVGRKSSGAMKEKKYFVAQFSDVLFYDFLLSIGLMPNKSKIIGKVDIPSEAFTLMLKRD